MDALLIHNPVSGHPYFHRALDEALARLRADGWQITTAETQRRGHSFDLAREAVLAGQHTILVAGGDGSIQQTIDGIYHAGVADVRLGIIPLGTGNVFARYVGLPVPTRPGDKATIRAAEIILAGDAVPVDIGLAGDHTFLCWAGMGIDADTAIRVESRLEFKRRAPILTYVVAALRSVFRYRPGQIKVVIDGQETFRGPFPLVIASNIGLYARWLHLAPDAAIDDGMLDLVVFTRPQPLSLILTAFRILLNPRTSDSSLIRRRCRRIDISADFAAPCHLDGDPVDTTPFSIRVLPRMLPIFLDRSRIASVLSHHEQP